MAILLNEPRAASCMDTLQEAMSVVLISAGTVVETGIVAAGRGLSNDLQELLTDIAAQVIPVTADSAHRAVEAYRRYGKGFHPARLNFGDCFAYELAKSRGCPLLYVGEDFARTDVVAAVTAAP